MKRWLQKTLIVAVALLTFGAISPNHEIWTSLQDKGQPKHAEIRPASTDYSVGFADPFQDEMANDQPAQIESSFVTSAKELSYMKFGTKIGPGHRGTNLMMSFFRKLRKQFK